VTSARARALTSAQFAALATGMCAPSAVRRLVRAQDSKQLLLIWGVVDQARRRGHHQAGQARHAYDLLTTLQRSHPAAVESVLMQPAARAWAIHTLRALSGGPVRRGAVPGALAALAAAALVRARVAGSIEVPVYDGVAMLPGVGEVMAGTAAGGVLVRSAAAGARVTGDGLRVEVPAGHGADAPGWRGLRTVRTAALTVPVRFVLDDLDPYRMPGATLRDRLSRAEFGRWRSRLLAAWELLVRRHAGAAAEIRATTTTLTPLADPADGGELSQRSASSVEAFGCTALSSPTDVQTLAVTLVHEVQHAKLAALTELIPLTLPDDGRRFYAPWRDDPRPLDGLLHGAYAHMMVSGFWRVERRHPVAGTAAMRAHAAFARWRAAAAEAAGTLLGSGHLTAAGEVFVGTMMETLTAWNAEPVPSQAMEWARGDADRHRRRSRAAS
jgi:uncharacterized protein